MTRLVDPAGNSPSEAAVEAADRKKVGTGLRNLQSSVARERDFLRIPEFPESLDQKQMAVRDLITAGKRGQVRGPLALMLYSPDLAEHAQALGEFVRYNSCLPPDLSEFVILMIARHFDCAYEWSAHAPIAEAAGIPAATIAALHSGQMPDFSDDRQGVVYRFVDQLLRHNRIDDETFEAFREVFGERGVIEVTTMMGYYALVGFILNSVRLPVDASDGRGETGT